MSQLISFSIYQTKFVIRSLFRQVMTSQTLRFFLDLTSKAMSDREKKEGRPKYKSLNISREQKELFRRNKKHFS